MATAGSVVWFAAEACADSSRPEVQGPPLALRMGDRSSSSAVLDATRIPDEALLRAFCSPLQHGKRATAPSATTPNGRCLTLTRGLAADVLGSPRTVSATADARKAPQQ